LAAWLTLQWWILPRLDDWRPRIEAQASRALGHPVGIGQISVHSAGWVPAFVLRDVVLRDATGREALRLPQVSAALSVPMRNSKAAMVRRRVSRSVIGAAAPASTATTGASNPAASGGSAGACSSLWLAFHDDMADPNSADPVARESTRLLAAAVTGAQTTLDPLQMKEWTPNSRYGGHAFGFMKNPEKRDTQFADFLAARDRLLPVINRYSPYALVSADDPPIYLQYSAPPAVGQEQKDPTHSANFGVKLKARLDAAGVPCELVYPGAAGVQHPSVVDYLIARLHGGE
jgi:hypothetical protein